MSFEDIQIFRALPIINGFVQVPHNQETDKSRVTTDEALAEIAGSTTERLSQGSGSQTGSKFGQQEYLLLPGITPDAWYTTDPVDDVADV